MSAGVFGRLVVMLALCRVAWPSAVRGMAFQAPASLCAPRSAQAAAARAHLSPVETGLPAFTRRPMASGIELALVPRPLAGRAAMTRAIMYSMPHHADKVREIDAQIKADDVVSTSTATDQGKVNLYAYNATGLEGLLVSWGQPKFRAKQLWQWLHVRGTTDFDLMLDIPKDLRSKLKEVASLGTLKVALEQVSKDGTVKRAYQLHDGQMIESVLMPYKDGRRTACISSQAGCAMGCVFCATGQMGFARQLTSSEILEQVQRFHVQLTAKGERLSNVVLMVCLYRMGAYTNMSLKENCFTLHGYLHILIGPGYGRAAGELQQCAGGGPTHQ